MTDKDSLKLSSNIDGMQAVKKNTAEKMDSAVEMQQNFQVKLPMWSGPFELLLDLVKTSQLSIQEISISRITSDYLATLRALHALDVDLAADFLVMASILVQIKTRSLLPSEETFSDDSLDYRDESGRVLINQLLNYQKFKYVAEELSFKAASSAEIIFPTLETLTVSEIIGDEEAQAPQLSLVDLLSAMERVAEKRLKIGEHKIHIPKKITIPVQEKIKAIRSGLRKGSRTALSTFFPKICDRYQLLGFLFATLELYRLSEIGAVQESEFDEIYLFPLAAFSN